MSEKNVYVWAIKYKNILNIHKISQYDLRLIICKYILETILWYRNVFAKTFKITFDTSVIQRVYF